MRVDSSASTSGIVSPSGNSSFWLRSRTDTRSGTPESFRIVSGIVPSRAVSVSVNVSGVVTWPLDGVDRRDRGRDVRLAARRRSRSAADGHEQVAVERSTLGLSRADEADEGARGPLARPAASWPSAVRDGLGGGGEERRAPPGCRRRRAAGAAWSKASSSVIGANGPARADAVEQRAAPRRPGVPAVERAGPRCAATLGCSRRRSASSASTRLTTRPGRSVGGQPLQHDRVGGEGLDGRRASPRRPTSRRAARPRRAGRGSS